MKRLSVTIVAVVILLNAAYTGGGVDAQDGAEATIEAQETEIAELRETAEAQETGIAEIRATAEARGKKINTQRTQIAELRNPKVETPEPNIGNVFEISGSDAVSEPISLPEGNLRAEVKCVGEAYSVFLAFQSAPGTDGSTYEDLAFGEDLPFSGTKLINIRDGEDVVLVLSTVSGDVTCTVTIS